MEDTIKQYGLSNKKSAAIVTFIVSMCGVLKTWLSCEQAKAVAVVLTICFVTVIMAAVTVYFFVLEHKKQIAEKYLLKMKAGDK